MWAVIDQSAVFEHGDLIGQCDRREAVGDHDRRAVLHHLAQRQLDLAFGAGVDRGGGIVEDQDARVGDDRPRDRQALALAPGESQSALADLGVVAVGQAFDEPAACARRCGQFDLLPGGIGPAVGDVVGDVAENRKGSSPTIEMQPRSEPSSSVRTSAPSRSTDPEVGS